MEVALGLADRPRLGRDAEVGRVPGRADDELGAAAADVDHDERAGPVAARRRRAEEREPRLLVARDDVGVEREAVVEHLAELVAVGGVAGSAGGQGDRPLGLQIVEHLLVVGQPVRHALNRAVGEAAGGVDALAEARHLRQALELVNAAVLDVCNQ
jgi:hypothetical protein